MNSKANNLKAQIAGLQKELDRETGNEQASTSDKYQLDNNHYDPNDGWATIAYAHKPSGQRYIANAKVHDKESDYGIFGSRVSKLEIRKVITDTARQVIFTYDRGWDFNETNFDLIEATVDILQKVC